MPLRLHFALFILLATLLASACSQQPTSHIQDRAKLLSPAQYQRIHASQQRILAQQNILLLIVTLDKVSHDINTEASTLFADFSRTETAETITNIVLLIDPLGEQVRIEVGNDLKGLFPDAYIDEVERKQMLPFFQQERIAEGIDALTELIIANLMRSEITPKAFPGQNL